MQIYKNILVTIDCSKADDAILDHISKIALQNQSNVFLLHVIHSHTLDQDRALKKEAGEYLDRYKNMLENKGIKTIVLLIMGEPENEILKEINNGNYDLVAMGTHGHSFFGDILYGSVSDKLKHKIDIPLLLLKSKQK